VGRLCREQERLPLLAGGRLTVFRITAKPPSLGSARSRSAQNWLSWQDELLWAAGVRLVGFTKQIGVGALLLAGFSAWLPLPAMAQGQPVQAAAPSPEQARAAAAYIYGYPMVDTYNVLYSHCFDIGGPEYKGPMNAVHHTRNLATPDDRAVIAPNVDTPYSHAWFDLRAEPLVLTLPAFEADRYVSLQLFDLYTYITGYVTPRTNGNAGGRFLLVGPDWQGEVPPGITGVFRSTTWLAFGLYRTQLLGEGDLARVHAIQNGFGVTPLSAYLGKAPPPAAAPIKPIPPVNLRKSPTAPGYFGVLEWMLRFMPELPEDAAVRAQIAGLGAGRAGDQPAIMQGMQQALGTMGERAKTVRSSAELFGSREYLGTDYLVRATGAMLGIFGNSAEEFLGVGYQTDSTGQAFDGTHRYRIRFAPGSEPPVGAFWSITVYNAERLLYPNAIGRYVIRSRDVAGLNRDPDGGFTLLVQHDDPGEALRANWLPIPDGPLGLTFRTYLPGEAVRNGTWRAPPVERLP
jgi:hypothetical protein